MTTLVQQRNAFDCAPACLAMLTGKPLDEVLDIIGNTFVALQGMKHEAMALERLGYVDGQDFKNMHRDWCLSHDCFRRFTWGRKALMTVPSLNVPNGWHMVYYDGLDVYDPSPLKTYTKWEDLNPDEAVIFKIGV